MLKSGTQNKLNWKPCLTVFAKIEPGQGGGSFEDYLGKAITRGYHIFGSIEYVTIPNEEGKDEIWGLTTVINEKLIDRPKRK